MKIGDLEDPPEGETFQTPHPAGESADPAATPGLNYGHESAAHAAEAIPLEIRADFVKYCEENEARLIGAAHRITGNPWDAEDAVQNVLERFWKSWSDAAFRERVRKTRGYSSRCVTNAAIDAIRSGRSRVGREDKDAREVVVRSDGYSYVEADESFRGMLKILEGLNSTWRVVIHLRYAEEFKPVEVAAILRISEATARRYEKRALRALEEAYKGN
ncbi:sigma-70 family RNA polymerase sigma factor [Streptomyces sp. NPDC046984]|uniref:RNA polymerase sigma factor n=1 Tax=unclassified Streptomyces TaxID=2593676 RepID=UPI0033E5308B